MICNIYSVQLSFHPVAVVRRLVQKWERDSSKGETVNKIIQKHRIKKIEKKTKKNINPLKTNRRPLYLKIQSVPRCKHFSSRL